MTALLLLFILAGPMCGDCDDSGDVTIDEIVRVVSFALGAPSCNYDCSKCAAGEQCWELFACEGGPVSFCIADDDDIYRCGQEAGCEVGP